MTKASLNETSNVILYPQDRIQKEVKVKKKTNISWLKWISALAAVLILAFGTHLGLGYFTPESVINFDVNPSIELRVNRFYKVLSATPLNEDAKIVLDGMNLKNTNLNVAVNALIGSMVKNGYINEIRNSILISVDSSNAQKGAQFQEMLSAEVSSLLDGYAVNGAILSQSVSEDKRIKLLSQEHNISYGKAILVDALVSQDPLLTFGDMSALSINDINLLLTAKQAEIQGISTSGQASSNAYIGKDKAKSIALAHSNLSEDGLSYIKVEFDYDDGRMIYEVEFYQDNIEYKYEIDASSGIILKFDQDMKSSNSKKKTSYTSSELSNTDKSTYIEINRAMEIALSHAGATSEWARKIDVELSKENGVAVYEVEFIYEGMEYEYAIDAITGEILFWTHERD